MNKLNDNWCIYIHLCNDTNWDVNSYKIIATFNTLEKAITIIENIKSDIITKSMIFIMKNNIKPLWEDPANKKGGCFSYKINNNNIYNTWKVLSYSLIGNTLINDDNILNNINGISISPKKNFCIIKLWFNDINNIEDNNSIKVFINNQLNNQLLNNQYNNEDTKNNNNIEDPFNINIICQIEPYNCIFRKHNISY
jgi:hypothetical protein